MTTLLFLDDVREVPQDGNDWKLVKSYKEFVNWIKDNGVPNIISFDHDLGLFRKSGMDAAKWLVEQDLICNIRIPNDFQFLVHSANPFGRANIQGLLKNYLEQKND
jgi:hypothetical protein